MAVPFASPNRPVLPPEYAMKAAAAGVTGAVVIEASGWLEDNDWVLDLAKNNKIIVGFMGNLSEVMGKPTFKDNLDRLAANPIFRGVRLGSAGDLANAAWKNDIQALADKGLAADVNANGAAAVRMVAANAKNFPTLKLILDHAGYIPFNMDPTPDWVSAMEMAAAAPNVYCKLSRFQEQSVTKAEPTAPTDVESYRKVLDMLFQKFGEDRIMFGSNWPIEEAAGTLTDGVKIMKAYFEPKGAAVAQKFFAKNAQAVYKWVQR